MFNYFHLVRLSLCAGRRSRYLVGPEILGRRRQRGDGKMNLLLRFKFRNYFK